ncbi:heme ABC transporter ATP-binding protein [Thalassococcus sp. S3]|uniref:heme ABC transporter ATP-binding protein n=1 Tax=Thalassococcus sp. S3 TaxID=2017482 RepID=UPI0010240F22|nr:heme ABC transporter ATP-binding protein [Thalassococcus sp. S3]QBF30460.1 heme ABC transporter ATP-binding protein [Thalassococcus sp. S3]
MLDAQDISVTYGRKTVLNHVSFHALAGQVTAIVGPNGSGKSTLMKAMTGDVPHTGQVTLNGRDVTDLTPWELASMRGVLPQQVSLAFPFVAEEIVRLGARAGLSAADPGLPAAALAAVGLRGYGSRYYQELSGGEQQRVQLARVLAQVWVAERDGQPSWLFLDEPVSSLDIGHQLEVIEIARSYASRGGGVVAVMHDLNLTAMCADRVCLMKDGRVLAAGPVGDVFQNGLLSKAYDCQILTNTAPPDPSGRYLLPHMCARRAG